MAEKVFVRDISDGLWREFKAGAAKRGLTVSKAFSKAIKLWLKHDEKPEAGIDWDAISNLGASGENDIAENHDKHIADAIHDRKCRWVSEPKTTSTRRYGSSPGTPPWNCP